LLGTRPSYELMTGCDTLLMVGTNFPYREFLPDPGQARAVQIDIDPRLLGVRYPTEVNLVGDSAAVLSQLLPLLDQHPTTSWRDDIEHSVDRWWRIVDKRAQLDANPINPQRVFTELSSRLPADSIIAGDSGCPADYPRWARPCHTRSPRSSRTPTAPCSRSPATARCRWVAWQS
jgi:pyruvate dehydrogenase (quinone)